MLELIGRGERHHLHRVVDADVEQGEVELLLGDGLHERDGVGSAEEQIELVPGRRLGERPARRPQVEQMRAAISLRHEPSKCRARPPSGKPRKVSPNQTCFSSRKPSRPIARRGAARPHTAR